MLPLAFANQEGQALGFFRHGCLLPPPMGSKLTGVRGTSPARLAARSCHTVPLPLPLPPHGSVRASRSTAPPARRAGRRLDLVVDLQQALRWVLPLAWIVLV